MPGLGTIVNIAAILAGGSLGLLVNKIISKRLTDGIMQGLGLAVLVVGLSGVFSSSLRVSSDGLVFENTLLMILSLAAGSLIGGLIRIEDKVESLSVKMQTKSQSNGSSDFSQGFMTATLIFSVGAMAIIGSLEDGVNRNADTLFAKSALDCITAVILAGTFGAGVLFSAIPVAVYQGLITALAFILSPYLNQSVVSAMTLVGSVLIIGISFNMLGIAKIKVSNLLPSIFLPPVYFFLRSLIIR